MKVRMVFQPFEDCFSLYDALTYALDDERLTELSVVVAWARVSGLKHIGPMLRTFRARGGKASILLGIDEDGATVEGLHAAIAEFNEASVLKDKISGTFHPKLYMVSGEAASIIIIGSNNLTRGGLFDNYEAGVCFELDRTEGADEQIHQAVAGYIERLQHDKTARPLTVDLIPQLRDHFHIRSEKRHGKIEDDDDSIGGSRSSKDTSGLFGASQYKKKRVPPPYPAIKSLIIPISDREEVRSLGERKRGQFFSLPLPGGGAGQVPCEAVPELIFWCWDTAKRRGATFTTAARRLGVPAAAEWSGGYQYIGLNPEHRRGKPPPPDKLKIAAHLLDKLKHA